MLGIAGAALMLLRGYSGARHQAIRRLLLLGFTVAALASLLVPQLWTEAAELLGVGRGTDLLLYLTILAFLGFVATSYLRFRDMQRQITALTRRLALDEALPPRRAVRQLARPADRPAAEQPVDPAPPLPPRLLPSAPLSSEHHAASELVTAGDRLTAIRSTAVRGRRSSGGSERVQHAAHR